MADGSTRPPLPDFDDIYDEAGAVYDLDPRWIKAHAMVESGGDPYAIGPDGEDIGVMQLRTPTARALGVDDRLDPRQNIFGGAKYLRQMLDQFGDPDRASMAYNAGPAGRGNPEYARKVNAHYDKLKAQPWRKLPAAEQEAPGTPFDPATAAPLAPTPEVSFDDLLAAPAATAPAVAQPVQEVSFDDLLGPQGPQASPTPSDFTFMNPDNPAEMLTIPQAGSGQPFPAAVTPAAQPAGPQSATAAQLNAFARGAVQGTGAAITGAATAVQLRAADMARRALGVYDRIDGGGGLQRGDDDITRAAGARYLRSGPDERARLRQDANAAVVAVTPVNLQTVAPPATAAPPPLPDFGASYNTPLSPDDEARFQDWLKQESRRQRRDMSRDMEDYDLRGAWLSGATVSGNGHFPDTFKKPNHPTFSDQSQYSGIANPADPTGQSYFTGGHWEPGAPGKWTFEPSATNLNLHGTEGLQRYFKRREPDATLVGLPQVPQIAADKGAKSTVRLPGMALEGPGSAAQRPPDVRVSGPASAAQLSAPAARPMEFGDVKGVPQGEPQPQGFNNAASMLGRDIAEFGGKQFPVAPEREHELGTKVAGLLGGIAPIVLGGAAAGAVAGPAGGAAVLLPAVAAQAYGSTYDAAVAKGVPPLEADRYALANAAVQVPLMAGGIGRLFQGIPEPVKEGFLKTLVNLGRHGVEFGSISAAARFAENYIAQQTFHPDQKLMEGVGEGALEGLVAGMVIPAAGTLLRRRAPEAPATERPQEGFAVYPDTAWPPPAGPTLDQQALPSPESTPRSGEEPPPAPEAAAPAPPPPEPPAGAPAAARPEAVPPAAAPAPEPTPAPQAIPMPAPAEATPATDQARRIVERGLPEFTARGDRNQPVRVEQPGDLEAAGAAAAEPTPAQAEAGNYRKGHVTVGGLPATIETPEGAIRRSKPGAAEPWEVQMPAAYGYIKGTTGADGEQVDAYFGPETHRAADLPVYVIDQRDLATGAFDEHKAMIGMPSRDWAAEAYQDAFSDGRGAERLGAITEMPWPAFRAWVESKHARKPLQPRAFADTGGAPAATQPVAVSGGQGKGARPAPEPAAVQPQPEQPAARGTEAAPAAEAPRPAQPGEVDFSDLIKAPEGTAPEAPKTAEKPVVKAPESTTPSAESAPQIVEHVTGKGKTLRGVVRTDLTQIQAKVLDPYTFRKKNAAGENGWFIREDRAKAPAPTLKPEEAREAKAPEAVKAPQAPKSTKSGWTQIGLNSDGEPVFEDARGVRSYVSGGIRRTEPVSMRPTRGGVEISRGEREGPYLTAEEHAAQRAPEPPRQPEAAERQPEEPKPQAKEVTETPKASTERPEASSEGAKAAPEPQVGYGAGNKTFTADAAQRARDLLKAKFRELRSGIDPEMIQAGITLAGYHIEAGARRFADYAKAMVADLGERVAPFLRSWYEGVRHYPGFDARGMSEPHEIEALSRRPEEAEHGLQGAVPEGDVGAGPEAAPRAGEVREAGRAPEAEGPGGNEPAGPVAGERAPAAERRDRSERAPRGRGDNEGDADRLPAAAGPGEGGAAGRPAEPRKPDAEVRGENFVIEPGALEESRSPGIKAKDNLAAIRLALDLEADGRPATKAEQAVLAKYVGWGGLSGAFPNPATGKFTKGMEKIGADLKALLPPSEYDAARASTQFAHYTAENVIRSMWDTVGQMGFKGGTVFEPGMGVGHFLGMMPGEIAAASQYHGVELDNTTARIAKLLYPKSGVQQADFIRHALPEQAFDLVIGNPPFSDTVIKADPKYAARGFMLHDYFFAKSLDAVRPGGLLAFVTSAGTMNKMEPAARQYLAERANFLGGVRLPSTAFKKNAGTEVTTDVLFFQRRPQGKVDLADVEAPWTETTIRTLPDASGAPTEGHVNRYFSEHPEMVLGQEGFFDKLYKGRYAVHETPGTDLTLAMQDALARLPRDVMTPAPSPEQVAMRDFESGQKKDGSFYLKNGQLMQYADGVGRPVGARGKGVTGGMSAGDRERVEKLVPLRDALRDVFRADLAEDGPAAEKGRKALNRHYDAFVQKFGPINKLDLSVRRPSLIEQERARQAAREEARMLGQPFDPGTFDEEPLVRKGVSTKEIAAARQEARMRDGFREGDFVPDDMGDIVTERRPNIAAFMEDPESYRLRAIEDYNDVTGAHAKREIFRESVLKRLPEPQINSANDGVLWSMNEFGRFDLDKIAAKMGRPREAVIAELGDSVFRVPGKGDTYQTRDEYLSGDVVSKLEDARAAAAREPDIRGNIAALEAAIPAPIPPSQLSMALGMPWIPVGVQQDFIASLGLGRPPVQHAPALGQWFVPVDKFRGASGAKVADVAQWGTDDYTPYQLIAYAMNRQPPKVYRTERSGGETRTWFDAEATQAAQDKVDALKQAFRDWINQDTERGDNLAAIYNRNLNREVLRVYDGGYLTTPGVATHWRWRPHQTRVVARIVQSGNTYMAHAVGAGKTSAMIGAGMEMKRLGLVNKPAYVVPNHMLGQFAKEFYEQYPLARIAVADERNFHTDRRRQFVANVSQQNLDAVIITHSGFGKVPISEAFQRNLVHEAIDEIETALSTLDEKSDRITVKRLENQKAKLEQKLSKRKEGADQTLTFEEMGVDFLFVDEAHLFRKLSFATKQSGLKGISPEGSDMAWDLYTKARYLDGNRPGRSLVLASGTPVTNTMGELYTLSRFMQPEALRSRGISHFDSWAQTFGDTKTEQEQTADGSYEPVTRFSRFVNMPELYKMVGGVMDIVTPHQLEQYVTRPKLMGGQRQFHLAPRTPEMDAYQQQLAQRVQAIKARKGKVKKGDDILLSVINDGRHAAIDPRFVSADAPSDSPSKLNELVGNVLRIWRETKNQQFYDPGSGYTKPAFKGPATQMIFANLGVNPRGPGNFSGYAWIKQALMRGGVPANEIAFIGDYKSHLDRQRLFNDVNEGKVRILVGSGQKMGTGVNAQRRLIAIHNQDPLWYPADDEQRNGRGIRQGNFNPEIAIHDYSTKGTYDATMWQMMGRKGRFIEQFFRGDPELREMEDLGEASMYEQASAMATMDERVVQLTEMKQDLDRAFRRQGAFESQQYSLRQQIKGKQTSAEYHDSVADRVETWIADRKPTRGDAFAMRVGDTDFTKRKDAGKALGERLHEVAAKATETHNENPVKVGEIGGFPLTMQLEFNKEGQPLGAIYRLATPGGRDFQPKLRGGRVDPDALVRSAEDELAGWDDEVAYHRRSAEKARREADELRPLLDRKFEGGPEMKALQERITKLEGEIKATAAASAEPAPAPAAPGEGPSFGRRVPLYSAVERAVGTLRQAKGTGEQMLAQITKAPGVKAEEVKWLGLDSWLKDQKSVTKDQIADYVKANQLQVEEVVRGEPGAEWEEKPGPGGTRVLTQGVGQEAPFRRAPRATITIYPDGSIFATSRHRMTMEFTDLDEAKRFAGDEVTASALPPRYSDYKLPGGREGYRELLIMLPIKPISDAAALAEAKRFSAHIGEEWDRVTPADQARYVESAREQLRNSPNSTAENYRSSHWDEPNVLAHIRFTDRRAPDGKRVLLIEESQSDWHQKGRREGYQIKGDDRAQQPLVAKEMNGGGFYEVSTEDGRFITNVTRSDGGTSPEAAIAEARRRMAENNPSRVGADSRVPDAPFKTSWPALAMRRMIAWAVEHGYDRVAWSPGEVHADRYSLSHHLSSLHVIRKPDGRYDLKGAALDDGRTIDFGIKTAAQLPDAVGKDMADRIIKDGRDRQVYSGEGGLKVGGAGMTGFYDRILPAETQRIIGRFGGKMEHGQVVGDAGMLPYVWDGVEKPGRAGTLHPVHQFDITPKLREAARSEGLPLFQRASPEAETPHPVALQAMLDAAGEMLGGHVLIEAYDPADKVFTVKFRDPATGRERTEQVFGYAVGRLIRLAIEGDRTQWNLDHEVLHGVRKLGVFTDAEWRTLEDQAKREDWAKELDIDSRYPGLPEDARLEEAIAEKFAQAGAGGPLPPGILGRLVAKLRQFLARLRNLLAGRGFDTAEDIFGRIREGEIGRREPGSEGPQLGPRTVEESLAEAATYNDRTFGRRGEERPPAETREQFIADHAARASRIRAVTKRLSAPLRAVVETKGVQDVLNGSTMQAAQAKLDRFTRALQMVANPMSTGSDAAQVVAKDFANDQRAVAYHLGQLDKVITQRFNPEQRAAMGRALDEQSVFEQNLRDEVGAMNEQASQEATAASRAVIEGGGTAYRADRARKKVRAEWNDRIDALAAERRRDFAGKGLDRLPGDQRGMVEVLNEMSADAWRQMEDAGIVTGEGLPFYMPRMFVDAIGDSGEFRRVGAGEPGRPQGIDRLGANVNTSGPRHRKYLEPEETERAGKAKLGSGTTLVRDIRALLLAVQRSQRAVASRALIRSIKKLGDNIGMETVSDQRTDATPFTMADHPAFYTYEPRYERGQGGEVVVDADGKPQVKKDADGRTVMDRKPIYIAREMEGPLRAVLTQPPGEIYRALMALKGFGTSIIMASPMIHNAVIWGRAFELHPGKMITFQLYRMGHQVRTGRTYIDALMERPKIAAAARRLGLAAEETPAPDAAQQAAESTAFMDKMIRAGMVPINGGWMQDILGIANEAGMPPGKSLPSKALGALAGAIAGDKAKASTRRAVDAFGDFWHGTLLWDRIADLQAGIAYTMHRELMAHGLSDREAALVAAHFANRFAGVLPSENMSDGLRKALNGILFSRQFTLGNAALIKDAFTGVPSDVRAQLSGESQGAAAGAVKGKARRMMIGSLMRGMFLMLAMGAVTQNVIQILNQDDDETRGFLGKLSAGARTVAEGYLRRLKQAVHERNDSPWRWFNPIDWLEFPHELTPMWENEPGKQDRVFWGTDAQGRGVYLRLPMGKSIEELKNWGSAPMKQLTAKLSTFAGPWVDLVRGQDSFGRPLFDADDTTIDAVSKFALHFMKRQVPLDVIQGGYDYVAGTPEPGMALSKSVLPMATGITVSRGDPLGPEGAIERQVAKRRDAAILKAWPDAVKAVKSGDISKAMDLLIAAGETPERAKRAVIGMAAPALKTAPTGYYGRTFERNATERDRERLENVTR